MSGTITLLIILLATLSTAFLSSIFGMLGGLILMGVLITIMPVSQAMVLHGLIQLTSNGYRAWLNKTYIKWNIVFTQQSQMKTKIKIIYKIVCDKKNFHTFAVPKINNLGVLRSFFCVTNKFADVAQLARAADL